MQKEVLIHVRGLQMMDAQEIRSRLRSLFRDSIISAMVPIISDMRRFWMRVQSRLSIT